MSLKGDRYELYTDVSFFNPNVTVRGGIASLITGGSGAAMDQAGAAVSYVANSSGARPVGVHMNDMVSYDLTRQHINFQRDEIQVGGKCRLLKKGYVVTSNVVGNPVAGDGAYLSSSGNVIPFNTGAGSTNFVASVNLVINPQVGYFASSKDEDGFAKVEILL